MPHLCGFPGSHSGFKSPFRRTQRKTKKSAFLWNLVELSYTMECEPEDWEGIQLERYIAREKNPELKAALEDLNEFLFC